MTANRCAIYTRKSSEEGLEQDFNSLDAQREACAAYIKSQVAVGWVALETLYDDGGISGGTLERPALQRLLADIEQNKIDTVVVYKVDRLTRSLSDFAKIVDAFDENRVSFVSVTQQFNTTTSMGRLTLNMLLSFAQFEREVTGERIRDKIAASKKKGMWMGGYPPLGYDPKDRKLIVNKVEAETVRDIFQRYSELGSVRALKEDLDRDGIVSKIRTSRKGRCSGGLPLGPGALYAMLQNPIYRGLIAHRNQVYPGLHDAIIDEALWEKVQEQLEQNRTNRTRRATATTPSLLAGLVYDDDGNRMSPTHASKKGKRYRYYVSQSLIKKSAAKSKSMGYRVPAADLETIIEEQICKMLRDPIQIVETTDHLPLPRRKHAIDAAADLADSWSDQSNARKINLINVLVDRVVVRQTSIDIVIRPEALSLDLNAVLDGKTDKSIETFSIQKLTVGARVLRAGMETRLVLQDAAQTNNRATDPGLLKLLGQAHRFQAILKTGSGKTITELAAATGVTPTYFTRLFRLNFLSPQIIETILDGRQPLGLTATRLKQLGHPASTWSQQAVQFEFD